MVRFNWHWSDSSSVFFIQCRHYYCADHQYHQNRHRHHLSLPSTAIVTSVRTWRHTSGPTWFRISCEANWLSCLIYPPGLCWSVSARIMGHGTQSLNFGGGGFRLDLWFSTDHRARSRPKGFDHKAPCYVCVCYIILQAWCTICGYQLLVWALQVLF